MHILYVDESGSVSNPNETFFVLGGVSVFERGIYHQIKEVDDLIAGLSLGDPHEIELHGNVIYQGREPPWRPLPRPDREKIITSALSTLGPGKSAIRLFAVAIEKAAASPRDPIEMAFEELCNRFNLFLVRQNNRAASDASQRGLIVMDASKNLFVRLWLHADHRANGCVRAASRLFVAVEVVFGLGFGRGFVCHPDNIVPPRPEPNPSAGLSGFFYRSVGGSVKCIIAVFRHESRVRGWRPCAHYAPTRRTDCASRLQSLRPLAAGLFS